MSGLDQLLPTLAAVQLVVVVMFLLAAVGVAAGQRRRAKRDERRLDQARGRLSSAVLSGGDGRTSALAAQALQRLRPSLRLQLVADVLATLSGQSRMALLQLADTTTMDADARRRCRSRRWHRRLQGLRELAVLGRGGDVAIDLLGDPDPRVRSEATRLAGSVGGEALIQRVVGMLADPAAGCRFAAADALSRAGGTAVPALTAALGSMDGVPLLLALRVSAAVGDPRLLDPTRHLTGHPDPAVRREVAAICAAVGGGDAAVTLDALLADDAPAVRVQAAQGLGGLGHWASAPALAERLRDVDFEVRRSAGLALWELGAPGQVFLRREVRGDDAFAADMARQVLSLPESVRGPD